jgi:sec-independent protein translocase protein TatB
MDDDYDDKPVASSMDMMDTTVQRLPAGQRAPYDPEST